MLKWRLTLIFKVDKLSLFFVALFATRVSVHLHHDKRSETAKHPNDVLREIRAPSRR
jgi:hypothetical protein